MTASSAPPALRGLPLVGNALDLANTITMPHFLARARETFGPVFTVRAPGIRMTALVGR